MCWWFQLTTQFHIANFKYSIEWAVFDDTISIFKPNKIAKIPMGFIEINLVGGVVTEPNISSVGDKSHEIENIP